MISANIITFNEEANIADCIASARQVCEDIVVVDSGSQDRTTAIARELGAKVVQQAYLGDGVQKNIALAHVKYDWVLSLDADERLTPEMVEAIGQLDLAATEHDAFAFRRRKRANSFSPFAHGLNAFVRKYIFQRGFMGGVDGMTVAISAGLNSYLKYAKLLEYQRDPKVLEAEDFNKVW
jgi:glycosyltransferase involved in cell wall biosynthesis